MGATIEQANTKAAAGADRFNARAAALGAAVGSATLLMGEFARGAAADEASVARLQQAVENAGGSWDEYSGKIDSAIKKGQEKAFSDDQTRDAMVKLIAVTNDTDAAMDQLGLAMDFARARNIDLSTSADIIAKVYGGNTGILSRYGIALQDGATATEALALIQQRSAGQAATYANTQVGEVAKIRDHFDEFTESLGAHAGAMQTVLMLLPGLSAGYSALAGVLAGIGGLGILGPAALLAGSGYLAYDTLTNDTAGSNSSDSFFGNFLSGAAGLIKKVTPGSGGDSLFSDLQDQYGGILDANKLGDAVNASFYTAPGTQINDADGYAVGRLIAAGLLPSSFSGNMQDAAKYIGDQASGYGLSTGKYLDRRLAASSTYTYDDQSGKYVYNDTYTQLDRDRRLLDLPQTETNPYSYGSMAQIAAGQKANLGPYNGRDIYNPFGQDWGQTFTPGGTGAVANDLAMAGPVTLTKDQLDAQSLVEYTKALGDQAATYVGLSDGAISAKDALTAFKGVQDGLLESEQVYSDQINEFSSQVSAQDAAYEILNQRKADGIELTKDQTLFLDNYTEANERGTGAVEDATIAQGELAQQYLLNMEKGDALNESLEGQTGAVDSLVSIIRDLILSLDGVPEEVRTRLELDGAAAAQSSLDTVVSLINQISGAHYFSVNGTVSVGNPNGPTILPYAANGMTVYDNLPHYANGGTHAIVGEVGPEMVWLPNGAQVTNAAATKSRMGKGNQGGNTYYTGIVNQYQSGDAYAINRSVAMADAR